MNRSPQKWVVLGAGVAAYAVAIMHRSSLGVAGLQAADHFGTTPGIVSGFVVLQLLTYAFASCPPAPSSTASARGPCSLPAHW